MAATPRTSPPTSVEVQPRPGLRERKKLKTRTAIRRSTYRLIAEQGYDATTIEQIAEAAEVSPSTVFRYFATKEDIALTDEYNPLLEAETRKRPADEPPLQSMRFVVTEALATLLATEEEELRRRTRLMVEVPAIRARMSETMSDTAKVLARVLADRSGRGADDLEVRVFVAAVLGALREVTLYWGEHGQKGDLIAMVDQALDTLEGGLTL
ncbi:MULTISPECIES: TetR/AcrR family transcriptional regulator [unclassified Streptomyces]|uniref:TetR/AcrR family transcriptional regulator n=1 Tax=unclassified Streptomyces TaxID=2593676 RepID=UPI0029A95811|nr:MULTISPECIES: TetR family transcriptional regulator [unclassified Streptomyces]MDX3764930.1 TetR family transcriptional regulator [Streptomyces sp. AK08-01B]MDX3814509.1 TetR family transcriptional regulator [Streptomyces sp. AK08-01A]